MSVENFSKKAERIIFEIIPNYFGDSEELFPFAVKFFEVAQNFQEERRIDFLKYAMQFDYQEALGKAFESRYIGDSDILSILGYAVEHSCPVPLEIALRCRPDEIFGDDSQTWQLFDLIVKRLTSRTTSLHTPARFVKIAEKLTAFVGEDEAIIDRFLERQPSSSTPVEMVHLYALFARVFQLTHEQYATLLIYARDLAPRKLDQFFFAKEDAVGDLSSRLKQESSRAWQAAGRRVVEEKSHSRALNSEIFRSLAEIFCGFSSEFGQVALSKEIIAGPRDVFDSEDMPILGVVCRVYERLGGNKAFAKNDWKIPAEEEASGWWEVGHKRLRSEEE